ncbi:hypothetical protein [Psychroserpens sp. SPM9]|uniref:hypothetical protein n=1 Tax=Psychroserpens sp. SPM9 TaxID=2975598 RepID=UPI0021A356DC|nr:hypothetical protein [Psychroserpens sp. SPM9]MDG5492606.1 hypothetical protein [Psychroserpens sp. SPM9]
MKSTYIFILALVLFSCGNERVLLLPEIENAAITEIHDVSHAYLFYDVTQTDSIELNRKNLISTTNWLINVDKRLSLAQAIPKIKLLQDKKRNAKMHKNEAAKNYYTCNDTSIQNLGFLEFTDLEYWEESSQSFMMKTSQLYFDRIFIHPEIHVDKKIHIMHFKNDTIPENKIINFSDFGNFLETEQNKNTKDSLIVYLNFQKDLNFQDYIKFKSTIKDLNISGVRIDNTEFIY